jgi:hypothetical protein
VCCVLVASRPGISTSVLLLLRFVYEFYFRCILPHLGIYACMLYIVLALGTRPMRIPIGTMNLTYIWNNMPARTNT